MPAEAVVWVDVEAAVRAWARDYVSLAARRVFFAVNNDVAFPQITLRRLGGPDSNCALSFDCWAATKAGSAALAAELASEADLLARYTFDGRVLHAAVVESVRWLPDFDSDQPRHVVDVTFVASSTTAA